MIWIVRPISWLFKNIEIEILKHKAHCINNKCTATPRLISKAKPLTCWIPNERCLGGEKVASLEEERCCWSSSVHEIIQTFFPSKGTVLSDSNLSGCPWHCEGWGTALRTCAIHMRIVWPRTWNRLWWRKIIPKQGTHKLFGPRLFKTKTNTATQVQ